MLYLAQAVAKMDHRAGGSALQDAHVSIAVLLVRHRLAVPAIRTTRPPRFDELIAIPFAILGDPGGNVVCPLPKDQADWELIKAHHHI